MHDRSYLKPTFWPLSMMSTTVFILSKSVLFRTLPGTDSSIIPLWLLQLPRSPFLWTLTKIPFRQSSGMLSSSHILAESLYRISTDVDMSAFKASAGAQSDPATLPFFVAWMAALISDLLGLSQFKGRTVSDGGIFVGYRGGGRFRSSTKCSV